MAVFRRHMIRRPHLAEGRAISQRECRDHGGVAGNTDTELACFQTRLQADRMKLHGNHPAGILRLLRLCLPGWIFLLAVLPLHTIRAGEGQQRILEFLQPADGAVFSTLDEIPVVLRAFAPKDVFLNAEVFANQNHIAAATFCCPLCPCARPAAGMQTTLQIPASWSENIPPAQPWAGWRNHPMAGTYRLTARAAGENGTVVAAAPVTITIVDLTLRISVDADGTVLLVIPQGSLVRGGYDLEVSDDLKSWSRPGSFSPGDVAAFYRDHPPVNTRCRFYRATYIPPRSQ